MISQFAAAIHNRIPIYFLAIKIKERKFNKMFLNYF